MTQEEKDETKLAAFKEHAQWITATNPEDKAVYLLKDKTDSNHWGFLVVSTEGESLDNHCGDCKRESVLFCELLTGQACELLKSLSLEL
jgi:hypothetical protein